MSGMLRYIIRRLIIGVLVVLSVSIVIFGIMQMMPGNPIDLMVGPRVTPDQIAEMKARWGLDKPIPVQYLYWLWNVLHGDFGVSITTKQQVSYLIMQRLPFTLMLTGAAILVEYLCAVPMGLLAAVKKDRIFDKTMTVLMVVLWSMPPFWLGILFMIAFAINIPIFPISGYSGFISLVLPALTLALPSMAQTYRLTRSEVLDVMDEKYVETAYAKGLGEKNILMRHVLRNALIPITVMFFLSLPWLIGGSVVDRKSVV